MRMDILNQDMNLELQHGSLAADPSLPPHNSAEYIATSETRKLNEEDIKTETQVESSNEAQSSIIRERYAVQITKLCDTQQLFQKTLDIAPQISTVEKSSDIQRTEPGDSAMLTRTELSCMEAEIIEISSPNRASQAFESIPLETTSQLGTTIIYQEYLLNLHDDIRNIGSSLESIISKLEATVQKIRSFHPRGGYMSPELSASSPRLQAALIQLNTSLQKLVNALYYSHLGFERKKQCLFFSCERVWNICDIIHIEFGEYLESLPTAGNQSTAYTTQLRDYLTELRDKLESIKENLYTQMNRVANIAIPAEEFLDNCSVHSMASVRRRGTQSGNTRNANFARVAAQVCEKTMEVLFIPCVIVMGLSCGLLLFMILLVRTPDMIEVDVSEGGVTESSATTPFHNFKL